MGVSSLIALTGIGLASVFFLRRRELAQATAARLPAVYRTLLNKYYVDEVYDATMVHPIQRTSERVLWKTVDAGMIDGIVNGAGAFVRGSAALLRLSQTGSVRVYAASIFIGVLLVVGYYLVRLMSGPAFALEAGQVSPPVRTRFGWHLVKVEAVQPAENQPLEQVRGAIARELVEGEASKPMAVKRAEAALAAARAGKSLTALFPPPGQATAGKKDAPKGPAIAARKPAPSRPRPTSCRAPGWRPASPPTSPGPTRGSCFPRCTGRPRRRWWPR